MRRRHIAVAAAAILALGGLAAGNAIANADDSTPLDDLRDQLRTQLEGDVTPEVVQAMQDSFGLSADQVYDRLVNEKLAEQAGATLRDKLGEDILAGAWLTEGAGEYMVAITDESLTDVVEEAGGTPVVVSRGADDLAAITETLNAAASVPEDVYGWFTDVRTNTVTITAADGAKDTALDFAADAGVPADAISVIATPQPTPYADIRGGDAYHIDGSARCSIGFAVTGGEGDGFLSAGHCGDEGSSAEGANGGTGTFAGSSFPGDDHSYIVAESDWTVTSTVAGDGSDVTVTDGDEAEIGASICRSGSTTGWHCGTVEAKDQTVNYQEGSVSGLTQTTVCAEPGDSGGSYITDSSAQGMTSGGSGDCDTGGTTFFQPVGEALDVYGVQLVTG